MSLHCHNTYVILFVCFLLHLKQANGTFNYEVKSSANEAIQQRSATGALNNPSRGPASKAGSKFKVSRYKSPTQGSYAGEIFLLQLYDMLHLLMC